MTALNASTGNSEWRDSLDQRSNARENDDAELGGSRTRSDSTSEVLVHGSCSKCHHLHRHVPLRLPRDDTDHKRFECQICRYPMFGLGRASTQVTLASVDSIPTGGRTFETLQDDPQCTNGERAIVPTPLLRVDTSREPLLGPRVPEELSAITERSSPGIRSRSTSHTQALPRDVSSGDLHGSIEAEDSLARRGELGNEPDTERLSMPGSRRQSRLLAYIARVLRRLTARICGTSKELRLLGFGVSVNISSYHSQSHQSFILPNAPTFDARASTPGAIGDAVPNRTLPSDPENPFSDPSGELGGQHAMTNDSSGHQNSEQIESSADVQMGHGATKQDRLQSRRRQKTFRNILRKGCDCTQTCHCKRALTSDWFQPSTRNGSSRRSSRSSDSSESQVIQSQGALAQVGSFARAQRRQPSTDNSGSTSDNCYRIGRSGRVPTDGSNESSISLYPHRPIFPGRRFSASTLPSAHEASHYVPVVADLLWHVEHQRRSRPSALASLRDGTLPPTGVPAPFGRRNNNQHVNSLNMATQNPATDIVPLDYQDGQPQISGTRTSSSTPSVDHRLADDSKPIPPPNAILPIYPNLAQGDQDHVFADTHGAATPESLDYTDGTFIVSEHGDDGD